MVRSAKIQEYKKDDPIIIEGDEGTEQGREGFFFLLGPNLDSEVCITVMDQVEGVEKLKTHLGVGAYFGERALINPPGTPGAARRSASIKAFTDVKLVQVPNIEFHNWEAWRISLILKDVPLLRNITDDHRDEIQSKLLYAAWSDQDVTSKYLFRQGEEGDRFFMITRGGVEVVDESDPSEERVLVRLEEGHCFGEMALLDAAPRNASARACEALVECAYLMKKDFQEALSGEEFQAIVMKMKEKNQKVRLQRQATLQRSKSMCEDVESEGESSEEDEDDPDGFDEALKPRFTMGPRSVKVSSLSRVIAFNSVRRKQS